MQKHTLNRRSFIKGTASGLAALSFPGLVLGQSSPAPRQEWKKFVTTPQYNSFLKAIKLMKANTNASSPASWQFWVNAHVNYCPHGAAYFLAWHRGYLYHFERQLRIVSGDATLSLPYWNYYADPKVPAEFTNAASGNPLYQSRSGTNVYNALDLSPFASSVWNFQRGKTNAFEVLIESRPHNPVHNLIGGIMATMQSPVDPLFHLHHCNIDRLWHAWAMPDGKGIPYTANPWNSSNSDPYWSGSFTYGTGVSLARSLTYYPGWLPVSFDNLSKPTSLPPQAKLESPFVKVQAKSAQALRRPAKGGFPAAPGRVISQAARSLGGVKLVGLDERSVSAQLLAGGAEVKSIKDIAAALRSSSQAGAGGLRSVQLVLDDVKASAAGQAGGYFYDVYLNLPLNDDATDTRQRYLLGTLGAFEVAGAGHHGSAALSFPATAVLAGLDESELNELTVSLVRVDGENPPKGPVLGIGEIRVEVSTDAPFDETPTVRGPGRNAYTNGG